MAGTINSIQIEVENSSGHPMTTSVPVTLTLSSNTSALSGTLTENITSGVATFSNLSVNQAGSYYLIASNPDLPAQDSDSFSITPLSTSVSVISVSPTTALGEYTSSVNLAARVTNLTNSFPVNEGTVTFSVYDATGTLVGQPAVSGTVSGGSASVVYTIPINSASQSARGR